MQVRNNVSLDPWNQNSLKLKIRVFIPVNSWKYLQIDGRIDKTKQTSQSNLAIMLVYTPVELLLESIDTNKSPKTIPVSFQFLLMSLQYLLH